MERLDGRVVVVTGGGNGLGAAQCRHLARLGAQVVVADRDMAAAEAVAAAIGGEARAVALDVGDERAVASVLGAMETVDVLVNNAGGVFAPVEPAEAISLEAWNRVLATNLTGPWLCARAVIPAMKRAGRGRIVNIASASFAMGKPTGLVPYITSKGGVVGFTRALSHELGPFGITVNAVSPGLVPKRAEQVHAGSMLGMEKRDSIREMVVAEQAIPRSGEPEDIAGAVAFLASDAAAFMTGQVMTVDGGWSHP